MLFFSKPPSVSNKRPHSTAASVPTKAPAPAVAPNVQSQSPGILSNILQTAAGVAVGHTVGRMVTGLFDGGSSNEAASQYVSESSDSKHCQADTKRFLDCMSQNYDDVAPCQSYLDMMRQCQQQFAQQ